MRLRSFGRRLFRARCDIIDAPPPLRAGASRFAWRIRHADWSFSAETLRSARFRIALRLGVDASGVAAKRRGAATVAALGTDAVEGRTARRINNGKSCAQNKLFVFLNAR